MTKDSLRKALDIYQKYLEKYYSSIRYTDYNRIPSDIEKNNHILWMVLETKNKLSAEKVNTEKVFRWIGFIQGALWVLNHFSIMDFRNHNRN